MRIFMPKDSRSILNREKAKTKEDIAIRALTAIIALPNRIERAAIKTLKPGSDKTRFNPKFPVNPCAAELK
jgi:hypothetical protein